MLRIFFIIPLVREKIRVKLDPAIPTGAPITLADKIIQTPALAAFKTIKNLSIESKAVTYLLNFLKHDLIWLISELNNFQSYLFHLI